MFAGVSLLLCAAAAGLWVRSYFVKDSVLFAGGDRRTHLSTRRGWVVKATSAGLIARMVNGQRDVWLTEQQPAAERPTRAWGTEIPGVAFGRSESSHVLHGSPHTVWNYIDVHLAY